MEDGTLEVFRLTLLNMDRERIIELCINLKKENADLKLKLEEFQSLSTIMSKDYKKMENELNSVKEENTRLNAMLTHSEDKNALRNKDLFGRSTEKMEDLVGSAPVEDPISEDASCTGTENDKTEETKTESRKKIPFPPNGQKKTRKPRRTRADLFSAMPSINHYEINMDELDAEHGESGWYILSWENHHQVHRVKAFYYVENLYTPVIAYKKDNGADHFLERPSLPAGSNIWPKSYVTVSLLADVIQQKSVLHLPYNRQAQEMARSGFPVSEQVLCQWVKRAAEEFLTPVYEMICDIVRSDKYQQGDETTLTIIRDGRKAGSTSYIWLHCTASYSEGPAAAVYTVELTRNADHLRKFYSSVTTAEFFYYTCDAYAGYSSFEKENDGLCRLTGCFMHARRRWAEAATLLPKDVLQSEKKDELPELKALCLIGTIYNEEKKLKEMTAEERHEARKTTTAPAVDAYFEYIKNLDQEEAVLSEKARDAISYSLNQEVYLRRFLEDGHLSCDNGHSERLIKPVALGRRNWLFNNNLASAQANCIIFSLAQTAILHQADVYYYFKYLLEKMPPIMESADLKRKLPETPETREILTQMLPWSEAYHKYEQQEKANQLDCLKLSSQEAPPKRPKKSKSCRKLKAG